MVQRFGVSQSQVSPWMKDRVNICRDACDKLRKLHKKGRKLKKYAELYPKLWEFLKQLELMESEYHFTGYGRRQDYFISSQMALMSVSKLMLLYISCKSTMSRCEPDSGIKKKAKEDMVDSLKKWQITLRKR